LKLYERKNQRIFYVLYNLSGEPVEGLLAEDIIFRYAKATDSEFRVKTLTSGIDGNFGELGQGVYYTDMIDSETDVIGNLIVTIANLDLGPSSPSPLPEEIDPKHILFNVEPYPIVPGAELKLCTIHGSVKTLGGRPSSKPMRVIAQVIKLPAIIDGNFLSTKIKESFTDEDGVFKMKLAIGATLRVEIPEAGIRRQFIVPDKETAKLEDLPSS